MLRNIIGASLGRRLAGNSNGLRGALIGAAAPWLLRRAFTPIGLVAIGAYGAKKVYDRRSARRARPSGYAPARVSATPSEPALMSSTADVQKP